MSEIARYQLCAEAGGSARIDVVRPIRDEIGTRAEALITEIARA